MPLITISHCPEILTEEILHNWFAELNVQTVDDFFSAKPEDLAYFSRSSVEDRLTRDVVLKLKNKIFEKAFSSNNLGENFKSLQAQHPIISSGIKSLDWLSENKRGFLETGKIYEVYGCPGVGKTQLSTFMSVKVAETSGSVLYVNTNNDFCVDRAVDMLSNKSSLETTLARISVCAVDRLDKLEHLLKNLSTFVSPEFERCCRLIVIDDIASLVLPLLREVQVSELFGRVSKVISDMQRLCARSDVAVIVINNATTAGKDDPKRTSRFKPALGKMFSYAADVRIFLERDRVRDMSSESKDCKVTIVKSFSFSSGQSCRLILDKTGFHQIIN